MTVHQLKTNQPHYQDVLDGTKTFEVRLNDRRYQAGDTLELDERDPRTGRRTGRHTTRLVAGVLHRAERWWPLSQIERHGLSILTLAPPLQAAESDLAVQAVGRPEPPQRRLDAASAILKERFSLAWSAFPAEDRDRFYEQVARQILQLP